MADPVAFKYRAFLSYSHRDKASTDWLQRALEDFRIDKDLVGRNTQAGPVPASLKPIFRDRDDFSAGHSLTAQTLAALAASQFLVVICSPNAAQSNYVNEEIRCFKAMGRAERVIAVIIDGEPGNPACECFPPALRFRVGADGELATEPEEPIAADARKEGDGKRLALQKIVAGLIGVPFDDLRKREAIADGRRIKLTAAAIAVVSVLALVAAYLVVDYRHRLTLDAAHQQQLTAMNANIEALTLRLLGPGSAQAAPARQEAVGQAVIATVKGAAEGDKRLQQALDLLKAGKVTEAVPLLRAVAEEKERSARSNAQEAAAAFRNLGAIAGLAEPKRALDAYTKAADLDPEDVEGLFWVGYIQLDRGYLDEAEARFRRVLALAQSDDHALYAYGAELSIGDILVTRGDLGAATANFRTASAIAEKVVKAKPADSEWQRYLSMAYTRIADVLVAEGNSTDALKSYREGLALAERLAKAEPANAEGQRDLSISYNRVGDLLRAQGNLTDALESYRDELAITERLAKARPDDARSQRDLSVSYIRVADVLIAQGNLTAALESYRDGLVIRERLAKTDPANAQWQRDLSLSYERMGDVLAAQDNLADALKSHRDSLAIRERLATAAPGNGEWQRDLAVSHEKVGDMLLAQGGLSDALKSYRDSLAITERLANADPRNAGWQRTVAISYEKVGDALLAQGDLSDALKSYRDSLAITERLATADPGNADWQFTVAIGHAKVGSTLRRSARSAEALDEFRKGREITTRLVDMGPDHADWQRELKWFEQQIADLEKR